MKKLSRKKFFKLLSISTAACFGLYDVSLLQSCGKSGAKQSTLYSTVTGKKLADLYPNSANGTLKDPSLVYVEGGAFLSGRYRDKNSHIVTITPFFIGKGEITNREYLEMINWCLDNDPNAVKDLLPNFDTDIRNLKLARFNDQYFKDYFYNVAFQNYPVINVSWNQAMKYCEWRSDRGNERVNPNWVPKRTTYAINIPETPQQNGMMGMQQPMGMMPGMYQPNAMMGMQQPMGMMPGMNQTNGMMGMQQPMGMMPGMNQTNGMMGMQQPMGMMPGMNQPNAMMGMQQPMGMMPGMNQPNAMMGMQQPMGMMPGMNQPNAMMGMQQPMGMMPGMNQPNAMMGMQQPMGVIDTKRNLDDDVVYFRLPTEIEWEFVASGAHGEMFDGVPVCKQGIYPWGDGIKIRGEYGEWNNKVLANFFQQPGIYNGVPGETNKINLNTDVFAFPPNILGVFDLDGNVAEWVADVYRSLGAQEYADFNPYRKNGDFDDAKNYAETGVNDDMRVLKGASWNDPLHFCQVGTRRFLHKNDSSPEVGFRVVMNVSLDSKELKVAKTVVGSDKNKGKSKKANSNSSKKNQNMMPQQNPNPMMMGGQMGMGQPNQGWMMNPMMGMRS